MWGWDIPVVVGINKKKEEGIVAVPVATATIPLPVVVGGNE